MLAFIGVCTVVEVIELYMSKKQVTYPFISFPIVVSCGALANPANGQVGHTGATFGQTATYSCNIGYNLVGGSTRTCLATGVWSGSAPTCQGTYVVKLTTYYTKSIAHV